MAEKTDLERAFDALHAKSAPYTKLLAYYDGDQPLAYTASRLKEIFAGLDATFVENWCAVVIDACKDKVNLTGLTLADGVEDETLTDFWKKAELNLESDSVHEAAMVTGESYFIAWPDPETGEPDGHYNDPRLCHVFYTPDNPRKRWFAAKWWLDKDDYCHLTLYYEDRLEHYRTEAKGYPGSGKGFKPDTENEDGPTVANPYGEVPVFHFTTQRRAIKSDIKNAIPLQDAINKLLTDMMVAAEFGAFPQRWVVSNAETTGKIPNAPNLLMQIPAGDGAGQGSSVGQFQAADLGNYLKATENLAQTMASITSTPKHHFFGVGGQLSGEALTAMEAPLNRKAQDRIDRFTPTWQQVAAFALKIAGKDVSPEDIEPTFDAPETVQPRTEAEILQLRTSSGVPLASALRMQGMSEDEIAKILRDKGLQDAQAARQAAATGQVGASREAAQLKAEQAGQPVADRVVRKAMDQFAGEARRIVGERGGG